MNPSCIEYYNYNYNYDEYNIRLNNISNKIKNNWKSGCYNTIKCNSKKTIKRRNYFFFQFINDIKEIKHIPFNVHIKK